MTTLAERIARLRTEALDALAEEALEGFAMLVCDGCGRTIHFNPWTGEPLDSDKTRDDTLAWGLDLKGSGDLCPSCMEGR